VARRVLVTGDVFLQENLLVNDRAGTGRSDGLDPIAVQPLAGGAWRLADLAKAAIKRPAVPGVRVVGPKPGGDQCRAFAVWAPYAPVAGKKVTPMDRVWRIERLLGAQRCASAGPLAYELDEVDKPDILLIEDLDLGFRDFESLWPKALREPAARTSIILHTCAPLVQGPLWRRLFPHRDRLTVVVSAGALRARGAGLTAPRSWDQTVEEIAAEFEGARFANDLALVRRVIVGFGADGAASFTRLPLFGDRKSGLAERACFERCLYDPGNLEGAWAANRPGLSPDGTSILAAAMARHELDPQGYPLFIALGRGLAAMRKSHEAGGGPVRGHEDHRRVMTHAIDRNRVALKGPVTTPIGGGFKSINVTLRKKFDLFANFRPIKNLPGLATHWPGVDLIIVRENTEGEYLGLEHEVVPGVVEAIKVITEKGSTRIAKFAFEYARKHGRKKVHSIHKANIMKLSDGLFLRCARLVAEQYPDVVYGEHIIDNTCMQLVMNPYQYDTLLLENLYGDIVSDLCAGLVGGLGLVPGANLGLNCAIFEAVHGSAPDIAGKDIANPTALLQSAVLMLRHLDEEAAADRVHKALETVYAERKTLTRDVGGTAGTSQFADAVLAAMK